MLVEPQERLARGVSLERAAEQGLGPVELRIGVERRPQRIDPGLDRRVVRQPERRQPVRRLARRDRAALGRVDLDADRQDPGVLGGVAEALVELVERAQELARADALGESALAPRHRAAIVAQVVLGDVAEAQQQG